MRMNGEQTAKKTTRNVYDCIRSEDHQLVGAPLFNHSLAGPGGTWVKFICTWGFIRQASTENQRTKLLVWFFKVVAMLRIVKSFIKICYISMKLNSIWLDVNFTDLMENKSQRKCLKSKLSVISYTNTLYSWEWYLKYINVPCCKKSYSQ